MYNVSKDKLKNSSKHLMVISAIATLLITAMGLTSTTNANAFNFGLESKDITEGGIDTDSLFSCVGAAIACINTNQDNNNVVANNSEETPIPEEPGTLTVTKEVACRSNGGNPSDTEVCNFASASSNFPGPEDYPITVTGDNPNPSNFPGSSTGTAVTINPGEYEITEELASTSALQAELTATSIITTTTVTGDCTPNLGPNQNFISAQGTMTSGGSQECTIINTVTINGGDVPAQG